MKINKSLMISEPPSKQVVDIPLGMVFSGLLRFYLASVQPISGTFLKLSSHVLDLETNQVLGAGQAGGSHDYRIFRVESYREHPNSELIIRD
jgi:hypothetical protein